MTVVAAEAAGGAAAGGAAGATGTSAAGGMAGEAAAGGGQVAGVTARKPAAGARGKTGKTGARGRTGAAGKSGSSRSSSGDMFEKIGSAEQAVDSGLNEARTLRLTPPKRLTVRDGAGFLAGVFAYVLMLNYIRYGKDGVTGWLGAKFVNRPWSPPDDSSADGSGTRDTGRGGGSADA